MCLCQRQDCIALLCSCVPAEPGPATGTYTSGYGAGGYWALPPNEKLAILRQLMHSALDTYIMR